MAVYSLAILSTGLVTGAVFPFWELRAAPLANVYLNELWATSEDLAGASALELQRTNPVGTAIGTVSPLAEDAGAPAAMSSIAIQWSSPPGASSSSLRRWSYANATGNGCYIAAAFPRGLLVPANASIMLDNVASATVSGPSIWEISAWVTE